MQVLSLVRQRYELILVEVELTLAPGLPRLTILGLPDAALKESAYRIKAAIRSAGFRYPSTQQIIVNLKPNDIKKSSPGLELAIVVALLLETKQINAPFSKEGYAFNKCIFYAQLSLFGDVFYAPEIETFQGLGFRIITGQTNAVLENQSSDENPIYSVAHLNQLEDPILLSNKSDVERWKRPNLKQISLSPSAARLAAVIASGEHSCLIGGPPGSGKTTLAAGIESLLDAPKPEVFRQSKSIWRHFGRPLSWRPVVQPHHTTPAITMLGGGSQPRPGEITRAHGGLLILDELLEFDAKVQEALREPLEDGRIRVARNSKYEEFLADFILVATTNLCTCGRFVPRAQPELCSCGLTRRHRYLQRLSGPLLDRFHCMAWSDKWLREKTRVPMQNVYDQIQAANLFRNKVRHQNFANKYLHESNAKADLTPLAHKLLQNTKYGSHRRLAALVKVARTVADLEQKKQVSEMHLEQARGLSLQCFEELSLA